jgi:hypothetical protein
MAAEWLESSIKWLGLMLGNAAIKLFESRKWFLSNKKRQIGTQKSMGDL